MYLVYSDTLYFTAFSNYGRKPIFGLSVISDHCRKILWKDLKKKKLYSVSYKLSCDEHPFKINSLILTPASLDKL